MARKPNKFLYEIIVQGFYAGHWSDESGAKTPKEARRIVKEYRDNCSCVRFRIIRRRELNPEVEHGKS